MDLRYKNPSALAPPEENDGLVSIVKWSSLDENKVASVHDQTNIKIWDIRAGAPLLTLDGHYDRINALEWSTVNDNEMYSASSDGTVRMWDIGKCAGNDKQNKRNSAPQIGGVARDSAVSAAALKRSKSTNSPGRPLYSVGASGAVDSADWLPSKSWRLYRQRLARENSIPSYNYFLDNQNPKSPCTTIFSNNKEFLALASVKMPAHHGYDASSAPQLVSIDNNGFFGVHSKIGRREEEVEEEEDAKDVAEEVVEEVAEALEVTVPYSSGKDKSARNSMDSLATVSTNKSGPDLDQRLDSDYDDDNGNDEGESSRDASPNRASPNREGKMRLQREIIQQEQEKVYQQVLREEQEREQERVFRQEQEEVRQQVQQEQERTQRQQQERARQQEQQRVIRQEQERALQQEQQHQAQQAPPLEPHHQDHQHNHYSLHSESQIHAQSQIPIRVQVQGHPKRSHTQRHSTGYHGEGTSITSTSIPRRCLSYSANSGIANTADVANGLNSNFENGVAMGPTKPLVFKPRRQPQPLEFTHSQGHHELP